MRAFVSWPDFDLQLSTRAAPELGRGAYAAVYRVQHDGVDYAVKALHSTAIADGRTVLRFRREAALLARVNHPAVPRVFDVGVSGDRPYLVMEYVDGPPLSTLLAAARFEEARIVRLGADVAGALAAAHRAGLVHRDVKPANILITADGGAHLGVALGSQSALVYGLRSIIVAPLELDRRLLGVVYLDSRVAKGIFTESDIEILTAVNSHIAVSLETARAAQLEVAVRAAYQQRDVAETLHDAMSRLSGTLDPGEVRRLLLAIVTAVSPADRACLVYEEDDSLTGAGPDGAAYPEVSVVDARALVGLTAAVRDAPELAHNVAGLLGRVGSWVAVPIRTHACGHGVLAPRRRSPCAVDIACTACLAHIIGPTTLTCISRVSSAASRSSMRAVRRLCRRC
jgi:tRNA A-37 threonylcarbamoyl transferase component Bud32